VSIDLRKVSSHRFGAGIGGGALLDPDTLEPLASGASITLAASGAPIGVSMAANLGGTDGDGIPFYIADAAAPAPTLSRIAITVADPSAQLGGEFMATLTYGLGGPTVSFWVDVRHRGCILKTWGGSDVDLNAVLVGCAIGIRIQANMLEEGGSIAHQGMTAILPDRIGVPPPLQPLVKRGIPEQTLGGNGIHGNTGEVERDRAAQGGDRKFLHQQVRVRGDREGV
jgi:hypothetical protein